MKRVATARFAVRLLRAIAGIAAALVALAALVILWRHRPSVPDLPKSLSSPVTTSLIQELVLLAAWLLTGLLVLVLLVDSVLALVAPARRQSSVAPTDGILERYARTRPRSRSAPPRAGFPSPFPLVPRRRGEPRRESSPPPPEAFGTHQVANGTNASIALLGPLQITPSKRRGRA